MASTPSKPCLAPLLAGFAILLQTAVVRWAFRADADSVWVFGRPLGWECSLRARLGVPCPMCGMTRSVVLSLQGDWHTAWRIAPAGPVAVAGLLALALGLLWLGWRSGRGGADVWARRLRGGALAWGSAAVLVWVGGWAAALAAALRVR